MEGHRRKRSGEKTSRNNELENLLWPTRRTLADLLEQLIIARHRAVNRGADRTGHGRAGPA